MNAKGLRLMYPTPLCCLVCWLLHSPIVIAELPMCNICLPPSNPIQSIRDVDIKDILLEDTDWLQKQHFHLILI